jgi:hypothetical protein
MERDPIREVKLVPVIMTVAERGEGTQNDPVREVTQFWSRKGELLAENDPHTDRG